MAPLIMLDFLDDIEGDQRRMRESGVQRRRDPATGSAFSCRGQKTVATFAAFFINRFDEAAMIAGGSGIPLMHQILEYARSRTRAVRRVGEEVLNTFKAVYTLDKPSEGWKEPTGYVNAELIKQHLAPAMLDEKVKLIVCRPPGQVAALAGKKAGDAQGELLGVSKGLNYTPKQASACSLGVNLALTRL
ncbi:hypothetical protein FB107DRAFT_252266 [Schizophyllum commune]